MPTNIATWNIDYNSGSPVWEGGEPSTTDIYSGESVTIQLVNFPGAANIATVTFYSSNEKGQKGAPITPASLSSLADVTLSGTSAVIEDINDTADASYWFSVGGSTGSGDWSLDPEFRFRPGVR